MNALIDEVYLYNTALTITAAQKRYLAGLNNLFKNKKITNDEYYKRISQLSKEYAGKK